MARYSEQSRTLRRIVAYFKTASLEGDVQGQGKQAPSQ